MAITDNNIVVDKIPFAGNKWAVSMYSADLTGTEEIKAAVAGKSHYIRRIVIRCSTATIMELGDGAAGAALTHIFLGPIPFLIASTAGLELNFGEGEGMKLTAGLAFCIDQTLAGPTWIYAEGNTA